MAITERAEAILQSIIDDSYITDMNIPQSRLEELLIGVKEKIEHMADPTQEQVDSAVSDWLDEHPEATTTVQDDSITFAKLKASLTNIGGDDYKFAL